MQNDQTGRQIERIGTEEILKKLKLEYRLKGLKPEEIEMYEKYNVKPGKIQRATKDEILSFFQG